MTISYIADYNSFHINCGGPDKTVKNGYGKLLYEGDQEVEDGASTNYIKGTNWGFSSTGAYMDVNSFYKNNYTLSSDSNLQELYSTARNAFVYLTYYGYCLENGNYTVNLHFAEIQLTDDEAYSRVARRIFDIYVQVLLFISSLFLPFFLTYEILSSKSFISGKVDMEGF